MWVRPFMSVNPRVWAHAVDSFTLAILESVRGNAMAFALEREVYAILQFGVQLGMWCSHLTQYTVILSSSRRGSSQTILFPILLNCQSYNNFSRNWNKEILPIILVSQQIILSLLNFFSSSHPDAHITLT